MYMVFELYLSKSVLKNIQQMFNILHKTSVICGFLKALLPLAVIKYLYQYLCNKLLPLVKYYIRNVFLILLREIPVYRDTYILIY